MANHLIVDSEKAVSKKACPHPFQAKQPPKLISINTLKHTWPKMNRTRILWTLTTIIGLLTILLVWIFPPYTVRLIQESHFPNGYSKSQSTFPVSIFWSWGPLPIYLAVVIGLSSRFFIQLYEEEAVQKRLVTGALLGGFLIFAIYLDQILFQFRPTLHITQIYHYQTGTVTTYEIASQTTALTSGWIQRVLLFTPGILGVSLLVISTTALVTLISSIISDWLYYYFSGRGWWGESYPIGYGGTIMFRKTGYLSSYARHIKHPDRTHDPRDYLKRELVWFKHPGVG